MIKAKQSLTGTLNTAIEYIQPVTQEKAVTPSVEIQEVTPDKDYTGLSKVTVEAVTNDIDSNILAENIKSGVEILGVQGSYEGMIPRVEEEILIFTGNVNVEGDEVIL